jgi:hypothetical protein
MKLFKKKKQIINAELSGQQGSGDGFLNTGSNTWTFIKKWAENELMATRMSNDSLEKDETQTAALRGRIKLLKEILALPEEKPAKMGLLVTQYDDDPTYAGY